MASVNQAQWGMLHQQICFHAVRVSPGAWVLWAQSGLRKAGQQCLVVEVVPVRGGRGGWEGQDRRSSLPAVCCAWIGDYSSRCVIRSGLYSLGCGPRSSEGEERTVGRACPTGITFDWCEVNIRDVASSFSWTRPWITPPHSASCFLTFVCPSSVPEIQFVALKSVLYAALSNLPIFLKTLILSREALVLWDMSKHVRAEIRMQ